MKRFLLLIMCLLFLTFCGCESPTYLIPVKSYDGTTAPTRLSEWFETTESAAEFLASEDLLYSGDFPEHTGYLSYIISQSRIDGEILSPLFDGEPFSAGVYVRGYRGEQAELLFDHDTPELRIIMSEEYSADLAENLLLIAEGDIASYLELFRPNAVRPETWDGVTDYSDCYYTDIMLGDTEVTGIAYHRDYDNDDHGRDQQLIFSFIYGDHIFHLDFRAPEVSAELISAITFEIVPIVSPTS